MIFIKKFGLKITKIISLLKKSFLNSLPNNFSEFSKTKKTVYLALYTTLLFSVFGTVLFQAPNFVNANINTYFIVIWLILASLLFVFDYKKILFSLIRCSLFIIPFLLYLILAAIFHINSFSSELARYVFLSFFILVLGTSFSTFIKPQTKKWILSLYILASFFLAILTYLLVLKNADLDSQIYAYGSKNSTGPILLCASIFTFFVFNYNKVYVRLIKWTLAFFFLLMIALMKCRAALIVAPIIYFALFIYTKPSTTKIVIVFISLVVMVILVFSIPFLKENIINNILLNNKTNLDDLSSGRLSSIIRAFQIFQPALGNGDTYVDCFPVQLICSYGIIGTLSLIPLIGLRFYILHPIKKHDPNRSNYSLLLLLTIFFVSNSLLEGHGSFGPGARSFAYWLIIGFSFGRVSIAPLDFFNKKICDKTSPNILSISLNGLISTIMLAIAIVPSAFTTFSSSIYDRLDRSVVCGEFIRPTGIEINGPDTICVGQTISYKANVYPENSSDNGVFWEAWSSSGVLQIDSSTGETKALGTGRVTINAFSLCDKKIHFTKVINVVQPQNYSFSNYTIDLEETELLIGDRKKVLYDNKYIPDISLIEFFSTNESVAAVDDRGIVTALGSGDCAIYSRLKSDDKVFSNRINLIIQDKITTKVIDLNAELPDKVWQHDSMHLDCSFNEGVTNKDLQIDVTGPSHTLENGVIIFKTAGNAIVKITSINNPSVFIEKEIAILKNSPVKFSVEPIDWICLNNKYKLNVIIEYESGLKRTGNSSDLICNSLRASETNSGICDDNFTLYTSMSGYAHVTYQSKENFNLTKRVNFVVRKMPYDNYLKTSKIVAIYLISLLSSIGAFIALIIKSKNRWRYQIGFCAISIISMLVLLAIQLKIWNLLTIIPIFIVILFNTIAVLIFKGKYFKLFDESTIPVLKYDEIELPNDQLYYQIEI